MDVRGIARRTGVEPERIEMLVDLGILRPDPDGDLDEQHVATARLAFAFEASGVGLADVGSAIKRGELPDVRRLLLSEPVGLLGRSHADVVRELGMSPGFARRVLQALGLPDVDLEAPIRDDDAELLEVAAKAVAEGLPEETLLVTMQVFAEHLDRMAEHQRTLFRRDIQDRLLATGMPRAKVLEASAAIRERLVSLGYRASHLIHRRLLERQQFENTTEQLEMLLHEIGIRRRPDPEPSAIVFVDLSGFTALTEAEGDERAVERSSGFAELVRTATSVHRGSVIKLLGDGAMLRFERVRDAPVAASAIATGAADRGLPPARAGIATGPLIRRDGDYFGHTVNLAARICDAADAGTVTATLDVAGLTPDLRWIPLGRTFLKGVPDPVELVRLEAGA